MLVFFGWHCVALRYVHTALESGTDHPITVLWYWYALNIVCKAKLEGAETKCAFCCIHRDTGFMNAEISDWWVFIFMSG